MRTRPSLKMMDQSEIEARFSNESGIKYNEATSSSISYDQIQPFLDRLPLREIDLLELYYRDGKNQKDIAKMFGVTQGAISSRLSRAHERLIFLKGLPKISDSEIDRVLGKYFGKIELEIIKEMIRTTCQSKTAEIINQKFKLYDEKVRMTQVKVRHRFEKCYNFLYEEKKKKPELAKYYNLLHYIKKNLYMLHEVKLPHFDRGKSVVFSMV